MPLVQTLNLAVAHHRAGRLAEAKQLYQQILAEEPNHLDALHLLGVVAQQAGRHEIAIDLIGRALALKPDWPEALSNLGTALMADGRMDEAIAAYRRALGLNPDYAEALSNLGNCLKNKGRPDEAVTACRKAIAVRPDYPEAHRNLSAALHEKGLLDEAIAACRAAVAHKPDYAEARHNLGMMLLLRGDFAEGWIEQEWRRRVMDSHFLQPRWHDSSRINGTILIHAEQGFGDALQFVRYVPRVAARCSRVIVRCDSNLCRVLQSVDGVDQCISTTETPPPFDAQCPLLSLPLTFGTTLETIPSDVPYLQPNSKDVDRWRTRLQERDGAGAPGGMTADTSCSDTPSHRSLRVGLAWAGRSTHANDRNRSLPLSIFGPLAELPGVTFFSLQVGGAAAQAANPPQGMTLFDWANELHDFAETAALIANLDLVISVDTAIVHLAAAMGKPVWTLLPYVPDWRWLLDRDDSPWYPTMRLFRQKSRGDWRSVIEKVGEAIALRKVL